jgi:hypothetical protein
VDHIIIAKGFNKPPKESKRLPVIFLRKPVSHYLQLLRHFRFPQQKKGFTQFIRCLTRKLKKYCRLIGKFKVE